MRYETKKKASYYERNKEKMREYQKAYRAKHKEDIKAKRKLKQQEKKENKSKIQKEKLYTVYLGDEFEFMGTLEEICQKYDWRENYVKWLTYPAVHKRENKNKPIRKVYLEVELVDECSCEITGKCEGKTCPFYEKCNK